MKENGLKCLLPYLLTPPLLSSSISSIIQFSLGIFIVFLKKGKCFKYSNEDSIPKSKSKKVKGKKKI